jgi:hypothetical protein
MLEYDKNAVSIGNNGKKFNKSPLFLNGALLRKNSIFGGKTME